MEESRFDADAADDLLAGAIARASWARRDAAADEAALWCAIDVALGEAAAHPDLFLSSGYRGTRREAAEFAVRSAVADLAVRLTLSESTVRTYALRARTLRSGLPQLWAAFEEGEVSAANASAAAEFALRLPAEALGVFDERVASFAGSASPVRFRERARRLCDRLDPTPAEQRHDDAMQQRRVWSEAADDGMCWLSVYLSAADGRMITARLDAVAEHLAGAPDEQRTRDQLRADAARDLLLDGPDGVPAVSASVSVTVPVLSLLRAEGADGVVGPEADGPRGIDSPSGAVDAHGADGPSCADDPHCVSDPQGARLAPIPATLDGVVPISIEEARRLAGTARSFTRLLTHPISGALLDVDRTTYRPPADLRKWVRAAQPRCDFPGCGRRAADCDLDHAHAWADGGRTAAANLRPMCRSHHRLKHEGGWAVHPRPDATTRWRSPTGFVAAGGGADPPPF